MLSCSTSPIATIWDLSYTAKGVFCDARAHAGASLLPHFNLAVCAQFAQSGKNGCTAARTARTDPPHTLEALTSVGYRRFGAIRGDELVHFT